MISRLPEIYKDSLQKSAFVINPWLRALSAYVNEASNVSLKHHVAEQRVLGRLHVLFDAMWQACAEQAAGAAQQYQDAASTEYVQHTAQPTEPGSQGARLPSPIIVKPVRDTSRAGRQSSLSPLPEYPETPDEDDLEGGEPSITKAEIMEALSQERFEPITDPGGEERDPFSLQPGRRSRSAPPNLSPTEEEPINDRFVSPKKRYVRSPTAAVKGLPNSLEVIAKRIANDILPKLIPPMARFFEADSNIDREKAAFDLDQANQRFIDNFKKLMGCGVDQPAVHGEEDVPPCQAFQQIVDLIQSLQNAANTSDAGSCLLSQQALDESIQALQGQLVSLTHVICDYHDFSTLQQDLAKQASPLSDMQASLQSLSLHDLNLWWGLCVWLAILAVFFTQDEIASWYQSRLDKAAVALAQQRQADGLMDGESSEGGAPDTFKTLFSDDYQKRYADFKRRSQALRKEKDQFTQAQRVYESNLGFFLSPPLNHPVCKNVEEYCGQYQF